MKSFFGWMIALLVSLNLFAQGGPPPENTTNKLPDFFPPSPEASALIKADLLNVGYSTGSPNINIPLYTLQEGAYSLPITLNYSSTGIKVDEYASMVGMGWNLNYGGVVSRTVMDKPDENRVGGISNLNSYNFQSPGWNEINFLRNAQDKESDIFTFSFPGYSGKFLVDVNLQPIQLTNNNLKIQTLGNPVLDGFQYGFKIITDDGTEYIFQDAEKSTSREPTGNNCDKIYDDIPVTTSWYLTQINLPAKQKSIYFTYTTVTGNNRLFFQSSITQTVSQVTWSEYNTCTLQNQCPIGSGKYSKCISQQRVESKFISKIETTDGDKVEFFYDPTLRADLQNGKRLSSFKVTNRNGTVLRNTIFNSSYKSTINSGSEGYPYCNFRLFLESVYIRNGANSSTNQLIYSFNYESNNSLPARLTYAQDFYGYYNGQTGNQSLIPILQSNDINYNVFTLNGNPGTGSSLVTFGNRSINATTAKYGLLTKITYPTDGYDQIAFSPNYTIKLINGVETEVLAGGNSVSNISSYSGSGQLALSRDFVYRNKDDNKLSSFLLTDNLIFSQQSTAATDGAGINCPQYECVGPSCTNAIVTSNANNPITAYGSQHIYFRSVQEITKGSGLANNGLTEHKYTYFNGGTNLTPQLILGNYILNASFEIVPDLLIIENETNVYKNIAQPGFNPDYRKLKTTERSYGTPPGMSNYFSYVVKKEYEPGCYAGPNNPPLPVEMQAYDVEKVYINIYTVRPTSIVEKEYDDNGQYLTKTTTMEYDNLSYTYPRRIITTESDGRESKVERFYPPDKTSLPYVGTNSMTSRNIINPPIDEYVYKKDQQQPSQYVLQTTRTNNFIDVFSDNKLYAPNIVDLKIGTNSLTQKIKYHSYDVYGNTREISKNDDNPYQEQHYVYLWDYNANYPVAKVQNAINKDQVAYTSFETEYKGNWVYSGSSASGPNGISPTGKLVFDIGVNGQIYKQGLTLSTYYVSYWSNNGAKTVSNSISTTTGRSIQNGWIYYEHKIVNPTNGTITVSGSGLIDELRLYPDKSLMTTMTYTPLVGITSQCDPNNKIMYYYYDDFSRLSLILDQDNNVVKKICYNYYNQPEDCSSPCVTQGPPNWQNIGSPYCEQVSCGFTGYQIQQQQDINPCSPSYGQTQNVSTYNPTACPPVTGVPITYSAVSLASGFTVVYTDRGNPSLQYSFNIPTGSGTLGCIPAGQYTISISKPGNNMLFYFGCGCFYQNGTSAYFGKVTVSSTSCNSISIDYYFE